MDLVKLFDEAKPGNALIRAKVAALLTTKKMDEKIPGHVETKQLLVFIIYLKTLEPTLDMTWVRQMNLNTFVFQPETYSEIHVALHALVMKWPEIEPSEKFIEYYQYLFARLRDMEKKDIDMDLLPWAAGMCAKFLRIVKTPKTKPQSAPKFYEWIKKEKKQLLIRSYRELLVKRSWDFFMLPGEKERGEYGEIGGCSSLACLRKCAPQSWITQVETLLLFKKYDEICDSFLRDFLLMELVCKHITNRFNVEYRDEWICFDRNLYKHMTHIKRMKVPIIVELRKKFTVYLFGEPLISRSGFGEAFVHWLRVMKEMSLTLGLVDISDLFFLIKDLPGVKNAGTGDT